MEAMIKIAGKDNKELRYIIRAKLMQEGYCVAEQSELDGCERIYVYAQDPDIKFPTPPNPIKEPKESIPNNLTILAEAEKIIYGDREQTYGHPAKNCETIAAYWNTHLKAAKNIEGGLTAEDVCVMMILLKQARLANTPGHRDSLVDTVGYTALIERINEYNSNKAANNKP